MALGTVAPLQLARVFLLQDCKVIVQLRIGYLSSFPRLSITPFIKFRYLCVQFESIAGFRFIVQRINFLTFTRYFAGEF